MAATIPETLHQTLFAYVKACASVLKDPPPVVLNRGDYDYPTVEVGDFTVHLEIREISAIIKRKSLVAVVGAYSYQSNYPDAPDDIDWAECGEYQQVWNGAAAAVEGYAHDRMMHAIDNMRLQLDPPDHG